MQVKAVVFMHVHIHLNTHMIIWQIMYCAAANLAVTEILKSSITNRDNQYIHTPIDP